MQTGQEDPEGRFALQFYRDGCATVVYVDDRVPVDPNKRPCFARTDDPCELWLLLLQKAFAKHHGVYETLKAGSTRDALATLTGGTSTVVDLRGLELEKLWATLKELLEAGMLGVQVDWKPGLRRRPPCGLLAGHAYGVVKILEAGGRGGSKMVKLIDPWVEGLPKGKWTRGSPHWAKHPQVVEDCAYEPNDELGFWLESGQEKGDSTSLQRECSARARFGNSTHASRTLREMIARPKISRNERKTTEIGAFEVGNFAPFSCPGSSSTSSRRRSTRLLA